MPEFNEIMQQYLQEKLIRRIMLMLIKSNAMFSIFHGYSYLHLVDWYVNGI